MRLPVLLVLVCACNPMPLDSGAPSNADDPPVDADADGDGSPASADCNDADATIHPDAAELCDGVDQDCDGTDGIPGAPEALLVTGKGDPEDISDRLASGVNIDISRPSTLYVCGGEWKPWLIVGAALDIVAADASFSSTRLSVVDADVTITGGAWAGGGDFSGDGEATVTGVTLGVGQLRALDGYSLVVEGVELGAGTVNAQGGKVRLDDVTVGDAEGIVVRALDGGELILNDVVVTTAHEVNTIRVDDGELTVDGLLMVDSPAHIAVVGSTATLTGLDVSGGAFPLWFSSSDVTLTDSVFTENEGVISNGATLVVEDTAFVGTHRDASIASVTSLTVRRTTFTGQTTEGTFAPYEVSFDVTDLGPTLLVEDCVFADSEGHGAALFTNGPTSVVNTTFRNMGSSQMAILGSYLNTPLLSDTMDGRIVFEGVTVDGGDGSALHGTLCPSFVDTTVTGVAGALGYIRSWDEEQLSCAHFGDGLTVSGGSGLVFESPVDFVCQDCTFTGLTGTGVVGAPSGKLTLVGGAIGGNIVDFAGLYLGTGTISLTDVDVGSGADAIVDFRGATVDDVAVGSIGWDGSGVVSVSCDDDGCR